MATVYSSEVAVGTYNRIRLRVEYSGTSAHCYIEFRRTASYTGSWGDANSSITLNGITVAAPYYYSGTVGTSWIQLCNASGFTIPLTGGTLSWTFNNPGGSSVLGASGTIDFPAQASGPTGLTLTNIIPGTDYISATVSITGWGTGSGNRYREVNVWAYGGEITGQRRFQKAYGDTLSSEILVNNSSEQLGGLNITPNTRYTVAGYASNGSADTGMQGSTTVVTLASVPAISLVSTTSTTVNLAYSLPADGGFYPRTLQYKIDNGSWVTVTTVSSGDATTGTFSITLSGQHTISSQVVTTAGATPGNSVVPITSNGLYGSVSDLSTRVTKLYGSVNRQTKLITKFYGSVNGLTKRIF